MVNKDTTLLRSGVDLERRPLVSVVSICFNHRSYIAQALDGFIGQKTTFPFEIIIADDCSTDDTQSVIKEYAKKYPDKIRTVLRKSNVGVQNNLVGAINLAKGNYIAMCEGDDYWTDNLKLQKQVDFLESNPDYSVCFHPVRIIFEEDKAKEAVFPVKSKSQKFDLDELLRENFIQTNSVLYRSLANYSKLPNDILPYDWYLHILHAKKGKIGYINRAMSVYRRREGSVWWKTKENSAKFWQKHALLHVRMLHRAKNIFKDDLKRCSILDQTAADILDTIYDELAPAQLMTVGLEIAREFPDFMFAALMNKQQQIKTLQESTHQLKEKIGSNKRIIEEAKYRTRLLESELYDLWMFRRFKARRILYRLKLDENYHKSTDQNS